MKHVDPVSLEANRPALKNVASYLSPVRLLVFLVGTLAITTAIFTTLYGLEKMKKITTTVIKRVPYDISTDDICLTPYCVKAANYLIESIDETVDPCEDFFQFSCGTWVRNTRIPSDASAHTTFNVLRTNLDNNVVDLLSAPPAKDAHEPKPITNARILYQSCINETNVEAVGVEPVLSFIEKELGGWPILKGSRWDGSNFNLGNLLLKLRQYSSNYIFRIDTAVNEEDSNVHYIEIGQADLALGQKQYYAEESSVTVAYREFMRDIAKALGSDATMIDQDVNNIYEFEKSIAKHHWTNDEQRERHNETVRTTIGRLSSTFNTVFDFTDYLRRLYLLGGVVLTNADVISVGELEYLNRVTSIIKDTPARVLQNYVVWRFLAGMTSYMPQQIRAIRQRFDRVYRGTSAERPRPLACGNLVNNVMGFAVSKLYIKKHFDQNALQESLQMIETIRDTFIEMLNTSTWMDAASKIKAIEKAKAMDPHIGYPEYLGKDDNAKLEKDYADYVFGPTYINNVLKVSEIKAKENFEILRKPVDRQGWGDYSAPSVVNAFYEPSKNQISFPAGILQTPFFNKDAPKYLNYGGIGVIIGHEITHGFDDTGRQFDKEGNRVPWWTDETIKKFNERKTCMIEQYSNYTIAQVNMKSDGALTQGEDIADNGGLREAFYAYQKWAMKNKNIDKRLPGLQQYSPNQLFFVNYAQNWCTKMTDAYAILRIRTDVHSLGQLRVIGPTSNFDEFDRAFGCKLGQANSRKDKCTVW